MCNRSKLRCATCGEEYHNGEYHDCNPPLPMEKASMANDEDKPQSSILHQLSPAELARLGGSGVKPTNPKDALGVLKTPASVVPQTVLAEVGLGMLEGAMKYGRHNYRVIGVRASVYYDATRRHLDLFWEGEDTDPDSKLSHITKAITSLVVLRDAMILGNWVDDRPPPAPKGWMDKLNDHVKWLMGKYPEPVKPYTALDSSQRRS